MITRGGGVASRPAILVVGLAFTAIVALSLAVDLRRIRRHTLETARTEARALYDLNLAYRVWSSGHGGVYVPVTESVRPNPYLAAYPRRDLVAGDGSRLTLVNPAMMTRQANAVLARLATRPVLNKVTSLKFVNPENAPDAWERTALRSFEQGATEASEVAPIDGQPYMRLVRPMITERSCLRCHVSEGYEPGDVRGALSVGVPMATYLERMAEQRRNAVLSHLLLWLIGVAGIGALGVLARRAEHRYAVERGFTGTAINAMPGVFFVRDERDRLVRWNRALEELRETGAAGLFGSESSAIVHPDDRERLAATMGQALREGAAAAEARLVSLPGQDAGHYYLTARRIDVEGSAYLVVSGVDITPRKLMEDQLRLSAVEWAATFDAIHDGIVILDADYRVLRCNAAALAFLGLAEAQVLGRSCRDLMHDGLAPEACPVSRALASGKNESAVLPVRGRTCLVAADPVLDAAGRVVKVVYTISDITEQRKLESQLFQAQKMEAVGTLAGGIAHDFNNILSAIVGYASLLEMKTPADDPRRPYVKNILASTDRAANLTRSLLSFSRKQETGLRPVSLNGIVRGFQKILGRLIGEDVSISVECLAEDLVVEADPGQIEQVLMNLATNARDAMPKGGRIRIGTERAVFDRDAGGIKRGEYAAMIVSDTGDGMDRETQEHLFEPFFTTKEAGKGTGLGLSIVYGIVQKHNGAIHVYSEQGLGTTFKIYLPLSAVAAAEGAAQAPTLTPAAGSGTILLVEDDQHTQEVARILLEEFGYTVIATADGVEALRIFRERGERIDLVLTDLIMPNRSGREAFEEMNRIRPGVRAVFMSGYSMDFIREKGLMAPGMRFLPKPINPVELLGMVRDALAG